MKQWWMVGFALCGAAGAALAQGGSAKWMGECAQWVAMKGYSVDYVEQRTGQRPSGNMAQNWRTNLDPKDAGPNDVVFLSTNTPDGKGQRVEVVDEVIRAGDGSIKAFRTSSMNIGKMVEPYCHVTENFGKVRRRTVAFDRVLGAWRPGKP